MNSINDKSSLLDIKKKVADILESDMDVNQKNILIKPYYDLVLKATGQLTNEINILKTIDTRESDIANIILNCKKVDSFDKNKVNGSDYLANKINISNYIPLINSFSNGSDFDILNEVIPSDNFYDTINKLISHYLLEKITLQRLIGEENTDIFEMEAIKLEMIMENLLRLRNTIQKEVVNNKLVYATTLRDNIIFLSDIASIAPEYYSSIYQAFSSIIDGRFKNNKLLKKIGESVKKPISQVRDNQIRVFYKPLENDIYLILGAVVKKIDCAPYYISYIKNVSITAYNFLEKYLNMSDNEKELLLKDGENITNQAINILTKRK